MLKHLGILNLIIFSFFSFSQDYISYHQKIIRAEQAILDSNYLDALTIYDSVFQEFKFVFAENCYTATQVAIVANQYDKAFEYIDRCFIQGLKIDIVENDSILVQLIEKQEWINTVLKYDSLREIYIRNTDWELRKNVIELYDLDQKWRDKHELHPWNFIWRPIIWQKWKKVTKKIVENKLIPMMKENGFPEEKLIGLDEKWMHHKRETDGKSSSFAFMIMIHYYSIPRKTDLSDLFENEVKKGTISPKHFASIVDFQAKWGKDKFYKKQYYNQWHKTKNTSLFTAINLNRFKIGLESTEVLDQKFKRGLKICKLIKEGKYKHIKLFCNACDS